MKKLFTFLMVTVLVLSLSVSAFAATGSAVAPEEDSRETADLPKVVGGDVLLIPGPDILAASPEEAKTFAEAIVAEYGAELTEEEAAEVIEVVAQAFEALESAVPEDTNVQYFCYAASAGEITLEVESVSAVTVMAFVNGEWVEVEVIDNGDGTYTFTVDEACPIAVLTK